MHDPDHEPDEEEVEDPEVDEQRDTGVQMKPQRPEDDDTSDEMTHDEQPDLLDDDET